MPKINNKMTNKNAINTKIKTENKKLINAQGSWTKNEGH